MSQRGVDRAKESQGATSLGDQAIMGRSTEVVRQPITARPSSRRRLRERLFLRFPPMAATLMRAVLRRPPSSWLRRVLVRDAFRLAVEAANRRDYEAAFALLTPEYETITPSELVGVGFEPVYHGRDGRLRFQQQWVGELDDFQHELQEVVDLGDQLLLLGRMKGIGGRSGATFDSEVAYVITVSRGRLVREQPFRSHAQAFEVVGLPE